MSQAAFQHKSADLDVRTGIDREARGELADALGEVLADTFMMFVKTQGVHWNVTGPLFRGIHELTEAQYRDLFEAIDEIAERIRALGRKAPASHTKFGQLSNLKDEDEDLSASDMIEMLARDHETVSSTLRRVIPKAEELDDYVTADMLIERMSKHEEAVWMLRATIADA